MVKHSETTRTGIWRAIASLRLLRKCGDIGNCIGVSYLHPHSHYDDCGMLIQTSFGKECVIVRCQLGSGRQRPICTQFCPSVSQLPKYSLIQHPVSLRESWFFLEYPWQPSSLPTCYMKAGFRIQP